jgi:hypothetical protein
VCVQVPCVYIPHTASSVTACNKDIRDMTNLTGQMGHDSRKQDSWDRTAGVGQSGQIGLTGQQRQVDLVRTERKGMAEHDSRDKIAGTVQPRHDVRDGTIVAEQPGQESWDRIIGTGQLGTAGSDQPRRAALNGRPGQVRLD